jgi:hypothetical protein
LSYSVLAVDYPLDIKALGHNNYKNPYARFR